jgi:shikimate dehydrogenase
MHNASFLYHNINAEYRLFEKTEDELEGFLNGLRRQNIYGLNVTVPYKEKVAPFLEAVSEEARLIGAVNTIRMSDARREGFNTDGAGFLRHLREDLDFSPAGKKIALLGAGGAAKAVTVYLSKETPEAIAIYDIDASKAALLASHLKEKFPKTDYLYARSVSELCIPECDLLINATPVGMKADDPCLVEEALFHRGMLVYDLIYNPQETTLLKRAKQAGAKIANGLGMLLYQGALSFQIWTAQEAPLAIMRKALTEVVYT